MSWLLLAFIPPVLYAITNVIDSMLLHNIKARPIVFLRLTNIIALIVSLLAVFPLYPVLPDLRTMVLLIGIGFLFGICSFLYFSAIQTEEISRIVPIIYLFVLVSFVLEKIFLRTDFTLLQGAGILLTVGGAALIIYKSQTGKSIQKTALVLALIYALMEGGRLVLEKYSLSLVHPYQLQVFETLGATIFPLLTLLFEKKITWRSIIPGGQLKTIPVFLLAEILITVAALSFFTASVAVPITFVSAILTSQTFFVLLFSTMVAYKKPHLIKEIFDPKTLFLKVFSVIMIMGGIVIIIFQSA